MINYDSIIELFIKFAWVFLITLFSLNIYFVIQHRDYYSGWKKHWKSVSIYYLLGLESSLVFWVVVDQSCYLPIPYYVYQSYTGWGLVGYYEVSTIIYLLISLGIWGYFYHQVKKGFSKIDLYGVTISQLTVPIAFWCLLLCMFSFPYSVYMEDPFWEHILFVMIY